MRRTTILSLVLVFVAASPASAQYVLKYSTIYGNPGPSSTMVMHSKSTGRQYLYYHFRIQTCNSVTKACYDTLSVVDGNTGVRIWTYIVPNPGCDIGQTLVPNPPSYGDIDGDGLDEIWWYESIQRASTVDHIFRVYEWDGTTAVEPAIEPGNGVLLGQNRPNPFGRNTEIAFDLPQPGEVRLEVFDVEGRLVRTLEKGVLKAGAHSIAWDGTDDAKRSLPKGVYFCAITTPAGDQTRKMVRLE